MKRMKKGRIAKVILWITAIVTFGCLIGVIGIGVWVKTNFAAELPQNFFDFATLGESPHFYVYAFEDRQNRIGTAKETAVEGFAQKKDRYVAYQEIPQHMIDAFVAIEDKRFYQHEGVDWYRTMAACINYLSKRSKSFGASTITQQLVKNITGNNEVTPKRKIQEILFALDLERNYDKSQIMELYLNVIDFSDRCNGIAEASEHYFGKTPIELTVSECATIAAITNHPSYYNPIRHPENNLARRNLILSEMYHQGYLSKVDYDAAISMSLALNVSDNDSEDGVNSWYIDMVIDDVIADLMREHELSRAAASSMVYRGGLRIDLAMDPVIQKTVEDYYKNAIKMPIGAEGTSAQSALIVIDSRTGDILGVAGAVGEKQGNRVQNFATKTKRPPGSTLKPISVYAPALQEGLIHWASVYDDVPVRFGENGPLAWPKNATGVYRGLTNVSYAVAHSTNTVSVRILEELGLDRSYAYAKEKFHLESMRSDTHVNDRDVAALALGQLNYGVTLREITAAYSVFADGGVYHPHRSYYRVLASDGRVLLSCPDASETVLSEENAAIMTKLLQGVVERGTSSAITLSKTVECAGKTGTSNNDGDRWFIGYTPDLICGVWCGHEYPEPLVGRNLCTDIWNRVMGSIFEKTKGRIRFEIPQGVVKASYCRDSGKLLGEACLNDPRGDRSEVGWFIKRDIPSHVCDCHILCDYDVENHGVSHGFCPDESLQKISLIRVKRDFPMQILVSDAQYVFLEDPMQLPPNPDPSKAYFLTDHHLKCGVSNTKTPWNASCNAHTIPPESEVEEPSRFEGFFHRRS